MGYLIAQDYLSQIQDNVLTQIIRGNIALQAQKENQAVAQAVSYLTQKYDTRQEFTATTPYSPTAQYNAKDRVYLTAPAWANATSYALKALVLGTDGNVYENLIAGAGVNPVGDLTGTWSNLGALNTIFYGTIPQPEFSITGFYYVNDIVFWHNKIYKCLIETPRIDDQVAIQYYRYPLPQVNVFPDDPKLGSQYWTTNGTGLGTYSIPPDQLPSGQPATDIPYWTEGDNRDPEMVLFLVDLVLFHLHSAIAPRNIPELRQDRYDSAVSWLKMAAKGDITCALPIIQPPQGNRIQWGGNIKLINGY